MNTIRAIVITFFGNYIINTVLAALVIALFHPAPGTGIFAPGYMIFALVSALFVALLAWWFFNSEVANEMKGALFGLVGFLVSVVSTFVSMLSNAIIQSGDLGQVSVALKYFTSMIWNETTLVLLLVWLIPAALVGWLLGRPRITVTTTSTRTTAAV